MTDKRRHRGPHPEDAHLFSEEQLPNLRTAASDLRWLLGRDYARKSALKIVGDRYSLTARQRIAVSRCTCSDAEVENRKSRRIDATELEGRDLLIDGFNVLTTVEAALSGGLVLESCDGCFRDMASMHGSYRQVEETRSAIEFVLQFLMARNPGNIEWLLDKPVSNSGRLRAEILGAAESGDLDCDVTLVPDPDRLLVEAHESLVASADSAVLDGCGPWINLARQAVEESVDNAWIVDLSAKH